MADETNDNNTPTLDENGTAPLVPDTPENADAQTDAEAPAQPEKPAEPEPLTAVSLGLIPEVFVSRVSTQLSFYAPEITPLPARPGRERDTSRDHDDDSPSGRRGRRRRGGGSGSDAGDQRDEPRQRQRAVEYITEPKAIKGSTRLEAKSSAAVTVVMPDAVVRS